MAPRRYQNPRFEDTCVVDESISSAGALHRFAARVGFALRAAVAEGIDQAFTEPLHDLLHGIGMACRPTAAPSAKAKLLRARDDVQTISDFFAGLASRRSVPVLADREPHADPLFLNDPWAASVQRTCHLPFGKARGKGKASGPSPLTATTAPFSATTFPVDVAAAASTSTTSSASSAPSSSVVVVERMPFAVEEPYTTAAVPQESPSPSTSVESISDEMVLMSSIAARPPTSPLLEVAASSSVLPPPDPDRLKTETEANEAAAAKEYADFMASSEATKKEKHDSEFKLSLDKDESEFKKSQAEKDLKNTQEELAQANNYYNELKPSCVQVHVSFEERVTGRKEEIAALHEAWTTLDQKAQE